MRLTINIDETKVSFFMELIQSFDFISIESEELSEEHNALIEERLKEYQDNPESLIPWEEVKKTFSNIN